MNTRSRKHHYVPQMILRGFAKDDRIGCFDLVDQRSYVLSVADAAAENDYNTLSLEDGSKSDEAERLIAQIEGAAAGPLRTIAAGGWFSSHDDRVAIAMFLALQYLRVPRQRAFGDHIADKITKLQIAAAGPAGIKEAMEAAGLTPTDEEVAEQWETFARFDEYTVSKSSEAHVLDSLSMLGEMTEVLLEGYCWCVIRWERRALATSDNPLQLVAHPNKPSWSGVGLGTAGQIIFGVTRRCALDLVSRSLTSAPDGTALPASVASARAISQSASLGAWRRVFHHPDDDLASVLGTGDWLREPLRFSDGNGDDLRDRLVEMSEWASHNPEQPSPFSRFPAIEAPARPRPLGRPDSGLSSRSGPTDG